MKSSIAERNNMICPNCGHHESWDHFGRLGQIVCLKCNDCIRNFDTGEFLVRKGDFDKGEIVEK